MPAVRGREIPVTEYAEMTPVEKAVADAKVAFENVLGQNYHYTNYEARKTHSLYMLKGSAVGRARAEIHRTLYHDRIRYKDATRRRYLEVFIAAAEESIKALQRATLTKTNTERIGNCISQLEDVVDYSNAALHEEDTEKAAKAAEEITRWPEDKERGQEIQTWGMCLTCALDILQNYGADPNADGDGIWSWTPSSLATELTDLMEKWDDVYRDEFRDIINALDDENIQGAWLLMYEFARKRKAAPSE